LSCAKLKLKLACLLCRPGSKDPHRLEQNVVCLVLEMSISLSRIGWPFGQYAGFQSSIILTFKRVLLFPKMSQNYFQHVQHSKGPMFLPTIRHNFPNKFQINSFFFSSNIFSLLGQCIFPTITCFPPNIFYSRMNQQNAGLTN
jgi:hypothetical protein